MSVLFTDRLLPIIPTLPIPLLNIFEIESSAWLKTSKCKQVWFSALIGANGRDSVVRISGLRDR